MDFNNCTNQQTLYRGANSPAYSVEVSADNAFAEPQSQCIAPHVRERVPSTSMSHGTQNAFCDEWSLPASPPSRPSMMPPAAKATPVTPQAHGRNQPMLSCAYTQNTVVNSATSQNPSYEFQVEATGIPACPPPPVPPRSIPLQHSENRSQNGEQADYNPFSLVQRDHSESQQYQQLALEQKQRRQRDERDAQSIELRRTVARLSLLVIQHSKASKQEVVSKLLSCDVIDTLYRSMFRYPQQTELQQETEAALNALREWFQADKKEDDQTTSTQNSFQKVHSEQAATPKQKPRKRASNPFIEYRADLNVYKCTECGKQYKHRCNLQSHSKIHTDQAYLCEFCGKKFGRKPNWMEHRRVHTGERPFICTVCQQTFRHKYAFKEHQRKKHVHSTI